MMGPMDAMLLQLLQPRPNQDGLFGNRNRKPAARPEWVKRTINRFFD